MSTQVVTLESLATRIAALETERDIMRTLFRYATAIDYGLEEQWLDCFTEDAVAVFERRLGRTHIHEGRAALKRFFPTHTHAPGRYHKHINVEHQIDLEGDEARVVSYLVRVDEQEPAPGVYTFGRYHDRMVKCPDGIWRIKERRVEIEAGLPARKQ